MSFGVVAASYLAAVPMTPADVSGLALWLKADTISGLTDGANVIAWQDTTNSVTAESHAALVPTYAANNTPIGLPAVRFSTSNSPLDVAGTGTPTDTPPPVRICQKGAPPPAEAVLVSAFAGSSFGAAMRDTSMASIQTSVAWFTDGPSGGVDTNWHVYVWTYDNAADTITYTVDGVVSSVSTANGPMASNVYFIGSAAAGFGGFGGLMAEIVAYTRVLSAAEITSLTVGLSTKYGL